MAHITGIKSLVLRRRGEFKQNFLEKNDLPAVMHRQKTALGLCASDRSKHVVQSVMVQLPLKCLEQFAGTLGF